MVDINGDITRDAVSCVVATVNVLDASVGDVDKDVARDVSVVGATIEVDDTFTIITRAADSDGTGMAARKVTAAIDLSDVHLRS